MLRFESITLHTTRKEMGSNEKGQMFTVSQKSLHKKEMF
jgi:hypothetical protein